MGELAANLDLRPRRDLFSRRRWRDRGRSAARTLALAVGDASAAALVLLSLSPWLGASSPSFWSEGAAGIPLAGVLVLLFQAAGGTYGPGPVRRKYDRVLFCAVAAAVVFVLLGNGYGTTFGLPRAVAFAALLGGLVCGLRLVADAAVRWLRRRDVAISPTLIIAEPTRAREVAAHAAERPTGHLRIVGSLTPSPPGEPTAGPRRGNGSGAGPNPPCLGSVADLGPVLERHEIRSVVVSARLSPPDLREILDACLLHGCSVGVVPDTLNQLPCRLAARDFLGWPLLELEIPRLHALQTVLKRVLDLAGSVTALVLLAPLLAGLAVAIRLESPGPVLFRQRRLGVGGRRFTIYKFRTMREDAERLLREDPELLELYRQNDYKLPPESDPRITRLGRFLRRTSLDELPQLLNVLLGHMSLVGPRPIVPDEIREYGDHALDFLAVKPGITGDWQVNGRSEVGYPDRARIEVEYVHNWSLVSDVSILARTVPIVLRRNGAH